MAQKEVIISNFNLDRYIDLLLEVSKKTDKYIVDYKCSFTESFRSNPFSKIEPYINETVKYGRYNNTKNRLLFGGEVDYITLSIYDILAHLAIWRLFNVLNEVELIKIKESNPDSLIELDRNFGTKFVIHLRREDGSYDREFEPISSPIIFKEPLYYISKFNDIDVAHDLYARFKMFGFVDWFKSINDISDYSSNLQVEQLSKYQMSIVEITEYADSHCWVLNSIKSYCQYCAKAEDYSGLKNYYFVNLLTGTNDSIKQFALNKLKDVMSFAYNIQYPILYNLRK